MMTPRSVGLVAALVFSLLATACFRKDAPTQEPASPSEAPRVEPASPTPAESPAPAPASEASVPAPTSAADAVYADFAGDAANGKRVFVQCAACHALGEGRHNVGPSLYQIAGRTAGTLEGFKYSEANATSGIVWTEEALFTYLEKPSAMIPGTIMSFAGLRKPQDRADLIAYLKSPD